MKAVCVGHSTYDITLPMNEYPEENIKHRLEKHYECGGGPASNGAYLLAKWGMNTTIMSVLGEDYYADKIIESFEEIGANTKYLEKRSDHATSSSYIIANMSNGSRTVLTSKKPPIRKLSLDTSVDADLILVDGEHPETALQVLLENPNAISVIDAGRLNPDTKMLGKLVTYLVCSKDFAEEFCNTKIDYKNHEQLVDCHKKLQKYFNTNVIITLESNGSFTIIDGEYERIPSITVKAVDSTGAGDIFHGAFTYGIAKKFALEDTLKFANIVAGLSVTRLGSKNSMFTLEEIKEKMNERK